MADDDHAGTAEHSAPVGFLELFYDLVFVAATMVLSNEYSHEPTWENAGRCALFFALLWLLWFHTTVLMNVDRRDDLVQRTIVFAQMFAIFASVLLFADPTIVRVDVIGIAYFAALALVAVGYHRVCREPDPVGSWAVSRRNRLVLAAVMMATSYVVPGGFDWIVYAVSVAILAVPLSAVWSRGKVPVIDEHHFIERGALLTLIVIGEAFVKAALVVSAGSISGWDLVAIVVMFLILFGLYSVYFDDVPEAGIRPGIVFAELWLLAHLLLQVSIVGLAVGMSKFLSLDGRDVPSEAIVVLMLSYSGIFLGLAAIAAFDRRVPRAARTITRLVTVVLAVGMALFERSVPWFSPGEYLLVLAALSIVNALLSWKVRSRTMVAHHSTFAVDVGFDVDGSIDDTMEVRP